jgi:signal transduction histidine kinase
VSRLYLKIYAAFLLIVAAFFLLFSLLLWRGTGPRDLEFLETSADVLELALPAASAPPKTLARALDRLHRSLGASLAVFDAEGRRLAETGEFLPTPHFEIGSSHFPRRGPRHRGAVLRLDDGRWVVVRLGRERGAHLGWLLAPGLLALLLAVGTYPLARGIASRLERLTEGVSALGAGDLEARVPVGGRDEVGQLAAAFNRTAQRISQLVGSQRTLLASASHELRSPLARLRVATELLAGEGLDAARRAELREQIARDVASLDDGVEELLLASRLDLLGSDAHASVDLLGLAAEEAARSGAELSGSAAWVVGDVRSLRHLIRNLLENAARHAPGVPPAIEVEPLVPNDPQGGGRLSVADRGPGIPPAERERIFAPFAKGAASERGVGLGLAIVRRVTEHHGGHIEVEAREGGGSVFRVELPGVQATTSSRPGEGR